MLVNPVFAKTASAHSTLPTISTIQSAPSTIGQDGGTDFTTQAALSSVNARQTNNIVGVQSYYDVVFTTTTTGTIKFIDITFPAGILIGASPNLAEREGIGAGTAAKTSATTIRYTVTSAVSVSAGTQIRLEFFNLVNPTLPSTGYKITVTTRNAGGTIIDGPTASNGFSMKQIGTGQIADNSITGTKPAESFMKKVTLFDNVVGNARGWNPNGVDRTTFFINEPLAGSPDGLGSNAIVNVVNRVCSAGQVFDGTLEVVCTTPPFDNARLDYTIINLPPNPVS